MIKWTSWIEHTGDTCPVHSNEDVKYGLFNGLVSVARAGDLNWECEGGIRCFKRLKTNVEAEKAKSRLDEHLSRAGRMSETVSETTALAKACLEAINTDFDVSMIYENYRGETSQRTIRPISLCFRSTEYHPEKQWMLRAFDVGKSLTRNFALRDCNFKAAQGNTSEAIETKASEPISTPNDTTPQPIITGVGEYKTRGGEKIYVRELRIGVWIGSFVKRGQKRSWSKFGTYLDDHAPHHDIIGPWVEPEPEEKPSRVIEGWVNVYSWPGGGLEIKGGIHHTKAAARGAEIRGGANYAGPAFLTHTVGEE